MKKKMGDDTSKHNLLIDSLSSSDSDHIPDLQLIAPERPRRKLRFSRRLPQVAASMNGKAQRLRMNYTNLPSCCLSIVLICIVTGLAVLSWFSLGLQKQIEEMRNIARNDDGLDSSSRSEIAESEQPPVIDSKQLQDLNRRISELDQKTAQLQKLLSAGAVKTNNSSENSGEGRRIAELTEMVRNLKVTVNETIRNQLIQNDKMSKLEADHEKLDMTINQVMTLGDQVATLKSYVQQMAMSNVSPGTADENDTETTSANEKNENSKEKKRKFE